MSRNSSVVRRLVGVLIFVFALSSSATADIGTIPFNLKIVSEGKGPARLTAIHNLWKLGVKLSLPADAGCVVWKPNVGKGSEDIRVCRYTTRCGSGTGMSFEQRGLAFCPASVPQAKMKVECDEELESPKCLTLELQSETQQYCRPGDVGGAPCGACGCDEAKNPGKCERLVSQCQKNARSLSRRDCTFISASSESTLRVGAVCDGRAVELAEI